MEKAKMISLLAYASIVFSFGFVVGLLMRKNLRECRHDNVRWTLGSDKVKCLDCHKRWNNHYQYTAEVYGLSNAKKEVE